MSSRKKKTILAYSGICALLAVAIVAALNVVSYYAHARLDLTRGRIFSMSPATEKIIAGLPDPVLITLYSSRELPPQAASLRNYTRDMMREYQSASGGKIKARFVEAGDSPESREIPLKAGIIPVRFDIYSRDKFEQREGFFGATLSFRDKKSVMPYINETGSLEYELTSRIKTLLSDGKPEIAFMTGRGAISPYALGTEIARRLDSHYLLRTLDFGHLDPEKGIDPSISALFILGGAEELADKELFALDQYLLEGRALFVAADTRRINSNALSAVSNEGGLAGFLAAHGINAGAEMVLDEQSQAIQLSRQQGYFMMTNVVRYPPFVIASDLDRNNPVTKDIAAVVMPFASPLSVSTAAAQGARVEVLARSSAKSWLGAPDGRNFSIDPYGDFGMKSAKGKGPQNLALFLERKFSPAFPPPKGLKSKSYLTAAKSAGRLAVTGTSGFIASSYNMPDANYLFFLNLVDWMSRDADLISIRSKQVGFKPLAEVSDHGKRAARYAIILLPPLMAVLTGLFMWKRRRALRARAARIYGIK